MSRSIPRPWCRRFEHGETVVTDTKRIVVFVNRSFDGPDLEAGEDIPGWLDRIMDLHYGVLMYSRRIGPDGELPPQITARGTLLRRLHTERPDLREMLTRRLDGNERMQAILADGAQIEAHRSAARALVDAMAATLADRPFLAGDSYSLADCFATAACARFRIHGFDPWWRDTPLDDYITRMKARPSYAAAGVIDTGSEADL